MTETQVYKIYYEEQLDCVVMDWDGYATSAQFREGTELMLNLLIRHGTKKVLADIKDMVIIGREDQEWLETSFLPRAINFGFSAIAMVKPNHYFNRVAVETVSYKIDREKLQINFFENVEDARKWLADF